MKELSLNQRIDGLKTQRTNTSDNELVARYTLKTYQQELDDPEEK